MTALVLRAPVLGFRLHCLQHCNDCPTDLWRAPCRKPTWTLAARLLDVFLEAVIALLLFLMSAKLSYTEVYIRYMQCAQAHTKF